MCLRRLDRETVGGDERVTLGIDFDEKLVPDDREGGFGSGNGPGKRRAQEADQRKGQAKRNSPLQIPHQGVLTFTADEHKLDDGEQFL
ncbi:MAG TPA: hypothetical protein VG453_01845, partial [Nitrospira sp.]|nr:hypothetical protein [Nitrospira sp.]